MNRTQLKYWMCGLMVLDHIGAFVPPTWSMWLHVLTRCVAPVFAYFAVEGYRYTRNKRDYMMRLSGAAVVMALGNTVLNLMLPMHLSVHNNIFATLALGVGLLFVYDRIRLVRELKLIPLVIVSWLVGGILLEGGHVVLPLMLITHAYFNERLKMFIGYGILSMLLFVLTIMGTDDLILTLLLNPDCLFITVVFFLWLYNGQKGRTYAWDKWFFYIFYPLHLWGIAIVAMLLNK